MTLANYLSFFILVLMIVYSPGPMTIFMMANGMKMQYKNIWPILIGANNAYLCSIILFSFGLTQILQKNLIVIKMIHISGILYLFYMAYNHWNKKTITVIENESLKISSNSSLYLKGALIALSNPKTIILFGIIFPQFILQNKNFLIQTTFFGATFLVLQFSSGCIYAYLGRGIKNILEKPSSQHLMNKISALILAIIAGFLLLKF